MKSLKVQLWCRVGVAVFIVIGAGMQQNVMAQAKKDWAKKDKKAAQNAANAKVVDHNMTIESPAGRIDYYPKIASDHRAPRPVEVWLPKGYDPESKDRYPVIYMHDGQFNLHHGNTPFEIKDYLWDVDTTMARLIAAGEIRPAIIVSVWADLDVAGNRGLEFMPQKVVTEEVRKSLIAGDGIFTGEIISDNYLKFLVNDVKPFIDKTYRTLPDRANTYVMGSSMGGLISAYAIAEYPEVFGAAATSDLYHIRIICTSHNTYVPCGIQPVNIGGGFPNSTAEATAPSLSPRMRIVRKTRCRPDLPRR